MSTIRFAPLFGAALLIALRAFAETGAGGVLFWDAAWTGAQRVGNLPLWTAKTGLSMTVEDSVLSFDIKKPDAHITRNGLGLSPSRLDTFLLRYRAERFTDPHTNGEIFYQNANHGFDDTHYVILPSLLTDGEWHEMIVPVKTSLRGGLEDWVSGGPITALRFDPVNQAPGHLEVGLFMLTPSLQPAAANAIRLDAPRWFFIGTDSFTQTGPNRFGRTLTLPEGSYTVWAHLLDSTPGRRALAGLEIEDAAGPRRAAQDDGNLPWMNVGDCAGGNVSFRLAERPSVFLDALIVTDGAEPPLDAPLVLPEKFPSEVRPKTDAPEMEETPATDTPPFPREPLEKGAPLESKVDMEDGVPRLLVNGAPVYPMIGNNEGLANPTTHAAYKNAGFNIEALWIDSMKSEQWWTGPGQYNFDPVDAKIFDALDFNPDILVLPIVWAAPPLWWRDRHPDEMAKFTSGETWDYYKSAHCFASDVWKQDAAEALTAFVRHAETASYASRVLGYWIVGGVSAEWQGWGCHASCEKTRLMDCSRPETEAFRRFLQGKYPGKDAAFDDAKIPSYDERTAAELGVFRDPVAAQRSVDFVEFYSESVADAILNCAGAVKAAVDRTKIVGVYFGYSLEYSNMSWAFQMSGHNRLRKVLDSPDVDFLSAPPSYAVRRAGQDSGWMWAFRSIQNAGKLVWVDDDTRTFLSGEADYTPAITLEQTRQVLRRNFAKAVCCLCPQGFLALTSGRELDHPSIAEDLRAIRRAGDYTLAHDTKRKAEIAVVVDEDSVKYLALDGAHLPSGEVDPVVAWNGDAHLTERMVNTLTGDLIGYQRDRIARIGAPVDYLLFSDFVARDLDYKCYIMLSCFQYDDTLRDAVQAKIYGRGATALWCYAPGFIHDGIADAANMEALTGIRLAMRAAPARPRTDLLDLAHPFFRGANGATSFGVEYAFAPLFHANDPGATALGVYRDTGLPALAEKPVGQGRSVFCGSNKLTTPLLRGIAREAGVHIYSDSDDPFEANENFILLHTSTDGKKSIALPEAADVVDVFTGEVIATDAEQFTVEAAREQTCFWFIGDADAYLK